MSKFIKKIAGLDPRKSKINTDETEEENFEDFTSEAEKELELEPGENNEEEGKEADSGWMADDYEEGQLSIDVYQTPATIVVKSTIAGVKPEDIDISINNDMLTIRGKREHEEEIKEDNYLFKECYWGSFSRSIILPMEVEADKIEAILENGVLTVTLPKAKPAKQISVKVREK